ncbi:hypothetical protein [Prescottella equi]|uniref:hypothetical protein n=1 Tax=Rhodococcus hoagii TaxID=43767 RepID=UPI00131C3BDA|nr:hypothetical protein [Prescottella equi]
MRGVHTARGLQPLGYDPFSDAVERGIEVGYLGISSAAGMWLPSRNAIIISSAITNAADRADMLAHMLGHADLEGGRAIARYHSGSCDAHDIDRRINNRVSRRRITPAALEAAVRVTTCAGIVAHLLGVSLRTLQHRVQALSYDERLTLGRPCSRLDWPAEARQPIALPGPCLHEPSEREQRLTRARITASLTVLPLAIATFTLAAQAPFP